MAEAKSAMSETRSAKGAATRDQILDAASRLIYLRGYHCTSLDDVLRESGVGKGNFYYYFRSKEELGFAIIDRLVHGFAERTLEPAFADAHADPVAQIHDFLDRLLENQRQRKCVGGCPMGNLASELSDVHEGFRQRLAGIFLRWRARLTDALDRGPGDGTPSAGRGRGGPRAVYRRRARRRDLADQGDQGHRGDGAVRAASQASPDVVHDEPALRRTSCRGAGAGEGDMSARTVEEMKQPEDGAAAGAARVDRDAELVAALRRQDPTAPEALVTTFGDRVYRLAIRITGNEQDAEEVVQDALWTAARKIDTFKGESAFGSWLYRITANAAYQKLRSRQSKRQEISWEDLLPTFDEMGAHAEPVRDWSARAEEPALQTELRTVLTTAINDLPGDYRTAFLLHDVEGLSNPEIAETLHISLPAVKSRVHRSRLFLRSRLSDYLRPA